MDAEARSSRAVADRYLDQRAALDPQAAAALGRESPSLLPDFGPDGFAARNALDRRTAAALPQHPGDALGMALAERLRAEIDLYDCGFTTTLLAPLATPVHELRQVFDDLPRRTEDDWHRVGAHLDLVVTGYRDYAATLLASVRRGGRLALRQIDTVAAQCRSWIDPAGTDFYRAMAREYPDDGPQAPSLRAAADRASQATADFVTALQTDLAPHATPADAVGAEIYAVTSRAFLGAEVDLVELYEYGWDELRRLAGLAGALGERLTGLADLPAARDALDRRPGADVAVGDELVAWLQGRLDEVTARLSGVHFDIPRASAAVEARMVTAGSGVMYYAPPDVGLTRPGRVWWSVPPGTQRVATWREVSTVHHEGLPGHHLQHAITMGLSGLHPWQRYLCHVHGYAEGWAHYAEQLAVELGLLHDDTELLGVYGAQLWRAARIVIDLGLHLDLPIPAGNGLLDAERWEPSMAARFLSQVAGTDDATARYEVDRYLGWPGQALAFKVGARLWGQARADFQRRGPQHSGSHTGSHAGDHHDLKRFHMAALGLGPMGLGPLRTLLAGGEPAR